MSGQKNLHNLSPRSQALMSQVLALLRFSFTQKTPKIIFWHGWSAWVQVLAIVIGNWIKAIIGYVLYIIMLCKTVYNLLFLHTISMIILDHSLYTQEILCTSRVQRMRVLKSVIRAFFISHIRVKTDTLFYSFIAFIVFASFSVFFFCVIRYYQVQIHGMLGL